MPFTRLVRRLNSGFPKGVVARLGQRSGKGTMDDAMICAMKENDKLLHRRQQSKHLCSAIKPEVGFNYQSLSSRKDSYILHSCVILLGPFVSFESKIILYCKYLFLSNIVNKR